MLWLPQLTCLSVHPRRCLQGVGKGRKLCATVAQLAMRLFARLANEQKSCLDRGSCFIPVP